MFKARNIRFGGRGVSTGGVGNADLASMAAGTVKLRARGAGTGSPVDGTGIQLGAILRLGNQIGDAVTTGSVATYTLAESTNQVTFNSVSPIIHGISVPAEIGQFLIIQHIGSGSTTLIHESGTAGASAQRLRLGPHGANVQALVIGQNQAATFTYDNRWVWLGTSAISANNISPVISSRGIVCATHITCSSGGSSGTADDVTIFNADCPFAIRILDAQLRVSTAVGGSSAALRTASGGGGSVVLPDPGAATQTFSTASAGVLEDLATATATVASGGSLFLRRSDRFRCGRTHSHLDQDVMAAAKATKDRSRKFPQDDWSIPLATALDQLLSNNDFATVQLSDQWTFQVVGGTLYINRVRVPEDV